MATIVNFKPAASPGQSNGARAERAMCEIIFFPGVRYERWTEPAQDAAPASQPRKIEARKKSHLEIALDPAMQANGHSGLDRVRLPMLRP